jgi:hypothetical protein
VGLSLQLNHFNWVLWIPTIAGYPKKLPFCNVCSGMQMPQNPIQIQDDKMKILGTLRQFPDRSLVSLALALAFSAPVGSASSATCAPKSSVTSSCQDLDLDGTANSVGAITVSSGATVTNSGDGLFKDYTVRFSGSIDSFTNNGIVSGVNGGGGTFLFLNGTSILNGIVNNGTLTSKGLVFIVLMMTTLLRLLAMALKTTGP